MVTASTNEAVTAAVKIVRRGARMPVGSESGLYEIRDETVGGTNSARAAFEGS